MYGSRKKYKKSRKSRRGQKAKTADEPGRREDGNGAADREHGELLQEAERPGRS